MTKRKRYNRNNKRTKRNIRATYGTLEPTL